MQPLLPRVSVVFMFFLHNTITATGTPGFSTQGKGQSANHKADCISGIVPVDTTANNTKLLFQELESNLAVTEALVDLLQVDTNLVTNSNGGPNLITSNFGIYSKLCIPAARTANQTQTLQFLSHGDTLDGENWDIAPNYSYIDAAAEAGYATFSYDRIGVGRSDHPDPLQTTQGALRVEIAHVLIEQLRSGQLGGNTFRNVVGVGHSAGSTVTQAVAAKYPKDFDAVVLSGMSPSNTFVGTTLAAFDLQIANTDPSGQFAGLQNAYIVQSGLRGIQFGFYRYPNFDLKIFDSQVAQKQTQTLGDLLTLGVLVAPATEFTGPVDIILGENDHVFCGGDCAYPTDQSIPVKDALFPSASNGSQHYLVPGSGHVINAHYSATKQFDQINGFLQSNGFH